jgi:DNA repair exonuclease SbcCD nuclease subunit
MTIPNSRKNIKFLFISDTHFGVNYAVKARNKLRYEYGKRFFSNVEHIIRHAIDEEEVDFILHGGDFFNRSKPPPEVVKKATSIVLRAAEHVPVYLIPGNHERSKLPFGLLEYHENIQVFSKPMSYIFEKNHTKIRICGFPYIRHNARKKIKSVIKSAWKNEIGGSTNHSQYNILLMHQLIQGSRVEHYTFNRGHNVIRSSDIPLMFHMVATGHVHRYQILYGNFPRMHSSHSQRIINQDVLDGRWAFGSSKGEKPFYYTNPIICYSGSPERVSMMERNENKGFIIGELAATSKKKYFNLKLDLKFISIPSVEMRYIKWDLKQQEIIKLIKEVKTIIHEFNQKTLDPSFSGVLRIRIENSTDKDFSQLSQLAEYAKENSVLLTIRIMD